MPAESAGRNCGRIICQKTPRRFKPRLCPASSRLRSQWRSAARTGKDDVGKGHDGQRQRRADEALDARQVGRRRVVPAVTAAAPWVRMLRYRSPPSDRTGMTIAARPRTSQARRHGRSLRLVNQAKGDGNQCGGHRVAVAIRLILLPTTRSVRVRETDSRRHHPPALDGADCQVDNWNHDNRNDRQTRRLAPTGGCQRASASADGDDRR